MSLDFIKCPIYKYSKLTPDAIALVDDQQSLSYKELNKKISEVVAIFKRRGVQKKTPILLISQNNLEYIILLLSIFRIQAIAVCINPDLPNDRIDDVIHNFDSSYIFYSIDIHNIVFNSNIETELPENVQIDLFQLATIVQTSGSSNQPKSVVHTYANHHFNALGSNQNIPIDSNDCWLLTLPLYHVSGLSVCFRMFHAGASIRLTFKNQNLNKYIQMTNCTHVSFVPAQLYALLENEVTIKNLMNYKSILLGGGPIPESLISECIKRHLALNITYGSTEMASQIATSQTIQQIKDKNLVKTLEYREIKISEDTEILVRGETLCDGYWGKQTINKIIDQDGWFHTGDLGELTEDKYLTVKGRKDNMFVSGGENIYPEEIESCLMDIEEVSFAIVIPVSNKRFGERPVALVNLHTNHKLTKSMLEKTLKKRLPKYKIPDNFLNIPTEWISKQLKLNRKLIRDQFYKHEKELTTL